MSSTTRRYDVANGYETGTLTDMTVVHLPGHPARD